MTPLQTLRRRLGQFGLRRSIAIYLLIVVGLALGSQLAIENVLESMLLEQIAVPVAPVLHAFSIAALVGIFIFFLFHGAVEDRDRANLALGDSEERFRSLTSLSADWFWETGVEHRLIWIAGGQPMLKLFGSELAYGRRLWEIPGVALSGAALETHLKTLAARKPFHELQLSRPGDAGVCDEYHLISGEPRFDRAGRFLGYRGVGRDVTDTKRAEQALSAAKERLELALESGALAIWDSDLSSGRIFLSGSWARMLGEPDAEQRLGLTEIIDRIHVQDREGMLQSSRLAVKGQTASFAAEIRLKTADGDWEWIVLSGRVVERDATGRALRMTGTVVSIDRSKRAELALRDAEARYRTLVDLSPDGVLLQSEGRIEYANSAAAQMLGVRNPGVLFGRNTLDMIHPDDLERMLAPLRYLQAGPGISEFRDCRILRPDGGTITAEVAGVSYLERGRLVVQTVLRDITEQVRAREELAERERRFRDVVEAAGEYVWETDADFRYTWLSARIESVLEYVSVDLLGRRPQEFMPLGEARAIEERLARLIRREEPFRDLVHRSITKSGRGIWQSISGVPVFDSQGTLKGFRGTGADITARKQAEERIQHLATRDAQTGLPNRLLLGDRAEQAILNAGRKNARIAVLSVQLDRFHLVTDSFGHRVGDALLRAIAERLSKTLRKDDTLARLGGEKFVLLWDGTREVEDVALVAQKVLTALEAAIFIEGRALSATASIGIGVYPGDGSNFEDLLKNAEAAGFAARESGGNAYRFFSRDLNTRAIERLEMEYDLRRALARGEFVLHYQPIVRSTGLRKGQIGLPRVVGAEVLIRWRHPLKGLLGPDDFLPVAQQSGLMGGIAEWLIGEVCERVSGWNDETMAGLWFALNASVKELSGDRRFSALLGEGLASFGLDGSKFMFEIAGRGVQRSAQGNQEELQAIADLGVALVIDDFGTGQADLRALRELPVRKLKIHRSLIAQIAIREDAAVIVQTVAAMAEGLGLAFAATGVENEGQLARLRSFGCEEWQGHLFSESLEAEAFEALLRSCASRSASG